MLLNKSIRQFATKKYDPFRDAIERMEGMKMDGGHVTSSDEGREEVDDEV